MVTYLVTCAGIAVQVTAVCRFSGQTTQISQINTNAYQTWWFHDLQSK